MSIIDVVDDLITLQELAAHEDDPERRRSLDDVHRRVAARERGVKVSEAAAVLSLSQPTVRAWIDAGVLAPVREASPVRIEVLSLADVKHALDLVRQHAEDRNLLAQVMCVLRDRADLTAALDEGIADLTAGRTVPLTDDLIAELASDPEDERSSRSA
jgi:hypothetical protein